MRSESPLRRRTDTTSVSSSLPIPISSGRVNQQRAARAMENSPNKMATPEKLQANTTLSSPSVASPQKGVEGCGAKPGTGNRSWQCVRAKESPGRQRATNFEPHMVEGTTAEMIKASTSGLNRSPGQVSISSTSATKYISQSKPRPTGTCPSKPTQRQKPTERR